jgi:hypothetical protein
MAWQNWPGIMLLTSSNLDELSENVVTYVTNFELDGKTIIQIKALVIACMVSFVFFRWLIFVSTLGDA